MTVPGNLSSPLLATAADSAAAGFKINRSLRFNSADSAYLNRTPSSAGNQKTFTLSCWAKTSKLNAEKNILVGQSNWFRFESSNEIYYWHNPSTNVHTDAKFRDPSAWYHIVLAVDTTQSTASDRVKIYINGVQQTLSGTQPDQDADLGFNGDYAHYLGSQGDSGSNAFNGYLAEIHNVDGSQLAASDFGEYDSNNVWQPKEYSGTYGTNGFRLDFSDNSSNSALGTDSSGNSNTFTVNNLSAAYNFGLTNAAQIVGTSKYFEFPITYATTVTYEYFIKITTDGTYNYGAKEQTTNEWNIGHSGNSVLFGNFNSGFTTFSSTGLNDGAWHFVRLTTTGSSTSFYVDGSLIATNSSGGNVSTGSEVTNRIEGTGSGAFHIAHLRITTGGTPPTTGVPDISTMNAAAGSGGTLAFYDKLDDIASSGTKTSDGGNVTITMNAATVGVTDPNADSLIDTPTNYTASSGNNGGNYCTMNPLRSRLTLSNGNLDSTSPSDWKGAAGTIGMSSGKFYWEIDNVVGNEHVVGIVKYNTANVTWNTTYGYGAETGVKYLATGGVSYGAAWTTGDVIGVAFDADNGILEFYKNGTSQGVAATGLTDGPYLPSMVHNGSSRSASINFGQRPWHHSPKADHVALCTTNLSDPTIADGSTAFDVILTSNGTGADRTFTMPGGFGPDLVWSKSRNNTYNHALFDTVRGAKKALQANLTNAENTQNGQVKSFTSDGFVNGSDIPNTNGESGVYWAWDAGTSNTSTSAGSLNSSVYNTSDRWSDDVTGATYGGADMPISRMFNGNLTQNVIANSGTSLTFSPSGFSSISSLRIYGSSYTGNANGITVNGTDYTSLFPSGGGSAAGWVTIPVTSLTSVVWSTTGSGLENGNLFGIEVDGKLLVDDNQTPPNVPSIASTVRANPTAGFSIATYTGNGSANQTLGHGLGNAPAFVIIKDRTSNQNWAVLHTSAGTLGTLDGGTNYKLLELSSTAAARDASYNTIWHPTNTTVKIGEGASSAHWTNKSGDNYVMYAWAPVEGFSSFGSYEGTASSAFTDPFIWTGFRPRWIIIKNIDNYGTGYDWFIFDTARDTFNVAENQLKANLNAAEVDSDSIDILSNGFSIKTTANGLNLNSHTHVWAAFAEHPFKTARAR